MEKEKHTQTDFHFNISLSVLNHLGRNLYRNFITVLGEAISNSWDADAENVWIDIDRDKQSFSIKDDGIGMSNDDFQNKFLKIGYSKRKDGTQSTKEGRPFIGRKGIGKLALLSCSQKISIVSKQEDAYTGGVIDNTELDKAIEDDLESREYSLGKIDQETYQKQIHSSSGTIISFENLNDGIRNTLETLEKTIALYFRFSLLDENFKIHFNGKEITVDNLEDLTSKTEFLWILNKHKDPLMDKFSQKKEVKKMNPTTSIKGFIASVEKPSDLTIYGMKERVSIDLFVNGRLRERDILKHVPKSRIVENYLYGQIHFDELENQDKDIFATNREGILADDPKYQEFLEQFKKEFLNPIIDQWDRFRLKHRQDGDPENKSMSKEERKADELLNIESKEYKGEFVNHNIEELRNDGRYNIASYTQCFLAENLLRKFIEKHNLLENIPKKIQENIKKYKRIEDENKQKGNISIPIRVDNNMSYLSMDELAYIIDQKNDMAKSSLNWDAKKYKPIRDAIAHTAWLTKEAKDEFKTIYDNIKGRVDKLSEENNNKK